MTHTKTMQERLEAIEYTMAFHHFREENVSGYKWSEAIWELFNIKNMGIREVYKLDVRQAGKDATGFYENFIVLTVPREDQKIWDDYLWRLGYGYNRYDVTLLRITAEWDEGIDDVIAEFDI